MDDQFNFDQAEGRDDDLSRETGRFYLARTRELLQRGGREYPARPCTYCASTNGILIETNGQNTVYCGECGKHSYNAPKTETGQRRRTVATVRPGIKPSQQARIFDRDQGRCVLCGSKDHLTIGHLLSIEEAYALGTVGPELNDDANLAAMCEACNLGLSRHSVSPRTYAVIMHSLVKAEIARREAGRSASSSQRVHEVTVLGPQDSQCSAERVPVRPTSTTNLPRRQ